MLCWGSWGNTQKLAAKSWRYELFYWDYVIGMVIFALLLAFTLGSFGSQGRPFLQDLGQASASSFGWILLGGVIFNASNILLSASTSIAGMSVAFPLGVGIALVLGVVNNYIVALQQGGHTGNVALLALGVALVVVAIICNGVASSRKGESGISKADQKKGIILALVAGILMSFFSSFVMRAMDLANFEAPAVGKVTPYTALVIFTVWRPKLAIPASILFGGLYILYLFIPTGKNLAVKELYKMLPYVVTIVVLVISSLRNKRENQPPESLGLPYFREER
jgi:glucose uptake protein